MSRETEGRCPRSSGVDSKLNKRTKGIGSRKMERDIPKSCKISNKLFQNGRIVISGKKD